MNILTFVTILKLYSINKHVINEPSFYSYLTDNYYKEILKFNKYYNLENSIDNNDTLFSSESNNVTEYSEFTNDFLIKYS